MNIWIVSGYTNFTRETEVVQTDNQIDGYKQVLRKHFPKNEHYVFDGVNDIDELIAILENFHTYIGVS